MRRARGGENKTYFRLRLARNNENSFPCELNVLEGLHYTSAAHTHRVRAATANGKINIESRERANAPAAPANYTGRPLAHARD
jgi:hypothetical protein